LQVLHLSNSSLEKDKLFSFSLNYINISQLSKHLVFSEFILISMEKAQPSFLTPALLPDAGNWAAQEQIFPAAAEGQETFVTFGLFPVFCHEVTCPMYQ